MPATSITYTVDPDFKDTLARFGAGNVTNCFNCGNCTAVCPLSEGNTPFPRKLIRYVQLGLKDQLAESLEPWLCFYCGECSATCPRKANPGETMMALRRYLTTRYDRSGLSRLMYYSALWEIGLLALVASVVVLLFTLPQNFGFGLLKQAGPAALASVHLEQFAPVEIVHLGDTVLALLLGLFLVANAACMFRALTRGHQIPVRFYFTELWHLIYQGVTQIRWKKCGSANAARNWLRHLFLVSGYGIMFLLVVIFLPWFQVRNSSFHWTSVLGYYATAVLLVTTLWIILDRVRQRTEMHRFSHFSDWLFPILLFLTAFTGILMHSFRMMDLAMPTYVMYVVHLSVAVPMLAVEVPFGKWAHLLYRPLAIYIVAVRRAAAEFSATEATASRRLAA